MPQIDMKPGDYVEVPKGPLDRPARLYWLMALFGLLAVGAVYTAWDRQSWLFGVISLLFACLFGVTLAGRFPALFFRRDR